MKIKSLTRGSRILFKTKAIKTENTAICEWLEPRKLFDVLPTGITPQQIQHAYGADAIAFDGNVVGNGTGQTIAIVIYGTHPTASTDLQAFDSYYGLPNPPSFHRFDEYGGTTAYPTGTSGVEESLDIEWAHVMAPAASIDVFECANSSNDLLNIGAVNAAKTPGVSVVSMSFGHDEQASDPSYNTDFLTPTGHAGVTFLASSGDSGEDNGHTSYPAESPIVVAVGGTVLSLSDSAGDYAGESGWVSSGGGISTVEVQPSYQSGKVNGLSSSHRTVPDVSMDAGNGVSVYDTTDFTALSPWGNDEGGTSLACPMFAGLVAVADQGRALAGLSSLDGATQTLPRLYNISSLDFHDITTGSNGYSATTGYDLVTGIGSPKANLLVNDLAFNAADLTVTNTNDSGSGSLRQAIINANAYNLPTTIQFNISTTNSGYANGVFTIKAAAAMPELTDNHVDIDGLSQEVNTGSTNGGGPVIFVDGGGAAINGFSLGGYLDRILYLGIDNFRAYGANQGAPIGGAVTLYGSNEYVQSCYIGVGPNGTTSAGNSGGVIFDGAINSMVTDGGSSSLDVIGFNSVGVSFDGSTGCGVFDTDIGISPSGSAVGNGTGVEILSGGASYGNSTGNGIQVSNIADNTNDGVLISGVGSYNNEVNSDVIGVTLVSGIGYFTAANGGDGIHIANGAFNNSVGMYGGTSSGLVSIIAGNGANGVEIDDSSGNFIQSSSIGEATRSIYNGHGYTVTNNPNANDGVYIHNGSSNNYVGDLRPVTSPALTGNVISGNSGPGIAITDSATGMNYVYGDYIGTDSSDDAIGNAHEGLIIFANNQTVYGCIISSNGYSGLSLPGSNNLVEYCRIGTNAAGTASLGNSHEGIYINGNSNVAVADVISGNAYTGVTMVSGTGDDINNCKVGTNISGTAAIPNQQQGMLSTASNGYIFHNVISGNSLAGISVGGSGTKVVDNFIGTNADGSSAITNGVGGVYVDGSNIEIGDSAYRLGNTISGNSSGAGYGVEFDTSSAANDFVEQNLIGVNASGTGAIPNVNGVVVQNGATNISIGTATLSAGNVISGNSHDGIFITNNSTGTIVSSNHVGTDSPGLSAVPNGFDGVEVNSSNTTIGGSAIANRNIISGNVNRDGVVIEGTNITNCLVENDYIGTDVTGTVALGNSSGIEVISGASLETIFQDVISGNANRGVGIFGSGNTSTSVQGCFIGTDYTGLKPIGNGGFGLYVNSDESTIGGSGSGQGDTMGFNAGGGIDIASSVSATIGDTLVFNNSNGGIVNAGTLLMVNDTVTANSAQYGGGIYNSGTLTLDDSTIVANSATSSGGGLSIVGGTATLEDDIVAQNTGGDVNAVLPGSSYNLIGDGTGLSGISNGVNHNMIGTQAAPINPLLGSLAYNGGTTRTLAPKPNSPAFNAGTGVSFISTDQRAYARPTSGMTDAGAVQHQNNTITITGAPAAYLRLGGDGQTLDIYFNNTGTGTPDQTYLLSDLSGLSIAGTTLNDQLTIDYTNGVPVIPGTGFSYDGLGGTNTLKIIGTTGKDTIAVNATTILVGTSTITYAEVQTRIIDPLTGLDSVTIAPGLTASFPVAVAGGGVIARTLSAGNIGSGAKLTIPTAVNHSDRTLLVIQTPTLASAATIDLGGNDADFPATSLSAVNSWVATGFNLGSSSWSGVGIDSSAAENNSTYLTALAVIQNNQSGTALFSSAKLFDGIIPGASDVLVKYTYYGDTNLDGKIDGSDYSRIDNANIANQSVPGKYTGWFNGDFNYDGVINGSDYALIDNAFNAQGASLATEISRMAVSRGSALPSPSKTDPDAGAFPVTTSSTWAAFSSAATSGPDSILDQAKGNYRHFFIV